MTQKARVAGDFSSLTATEGFFKVSGSHLHCECGNISEKSYDRDGVTTSH